MTKSTIDIDTIRKDVESLSAAEFETKYPGIKKDNVSDLSDEELKKVAGGFLPIWYTKVKKGAFP